MKNDGKQNPYLTEAQPQEMFAVGFAAGLSMGFFADGVKKCFSSRDDQNQENVRGLYPN